MKRTMLLLLVAGLWFGWAPSAQAQVPDLNQLLEDLLGGGQPPPPHPEPSPPYTVVCSNTAECCCDDSNHAVTGGGGQCNTSVHHIWRSSASNDSCWVVICADQSGVVGPHTRPFESTVTCMP